MALTPENKHHTDAIITLGLQLANDGTPQPSLLQRVSTAVELFNEQVAAGQPAPFLVMSGSYSGNATQIPPYTEAEVMTGYALSLGAPREAILEESRSLDTFGNALFTKILSSEQGWRKLKIVTEHYHLDPALAIFGHVLGPDYELSGAVAGEPYDTPEQVSYVRRAAITLQSVVEVTPTGDDEAIRARLREVMPAYQTLFADSAGVAQLHRAVHDEQAQRSLAQAA